MADDFDYGAAMDAHVEAQRAQANGALANTDGVSSADAISAQQNGPIVGVPPSVAMRAPGWTMDQAMAQRDADAIQSSPPVRNFVANADPSHVAIARGDLPSLAQIATAFPTATQAFSDIATAFGSEWKGLQTLVQQHPGVALGSGIWGPIYAAGRLSQTPLAALFEPVVRTLAPGVGSTAPLNPFEAPRFNLTQAEREQEVRNIFNVATLALGPGEHGSPAGLGTAGGEAAGGARGSAAPPPPTPEGGAGPFTSAGEAAQWIRRNAPAGEVGQFQVRNEGPYYTVHPQEIVPPVENVPAPGEHPGVDAVRGAVAEADAAHVSSVQEQVAENATFRANPPTMQAFLDSHLPNQTVDVDAEVLAQHMAQGVNVFPGMEGEVSRALESGEPVSVPLSKYLTDTAGKSYAADINAATSFREGGVSVNEAKEGAPQPAPTAEPAPVDDHGLEAGGESTRAQAMAREYTDAAQRIFASQYLAPLFSEAKALDLTEPQMERFSAALKDLANDARDRAMAKAVRAVKAERGPEFAAAADKHASVVADAMNVRRDVVATRQLSTTGFKLDRDLTSNFFPEPASRLPKGVMKNNGNHPDDAADLLGYNSGAEMVHELAALHDEVQASGAKNLNDYIKQVARREGANQAARDFGHDLTPESLWEAANELVPQAKLEALLIDDLQAFATQHGLPFDAHAMKSRAAQLFDAMQVKDALNLRKLERAVHSNGKKAFGAMQKGDVLRAFRSKQLQFIRRRMLMEGFEFARTFAKNDRVWSRLAKKQLIKSVGPDWSPQILNALREMGYNIKRPLADLANDLRGPDGQIVSTEKFLTEKAMGGGDMLYSRIPLNADASPLGMRNMDVASYRGAADMINSMRAQGSAENKVRVNKKKVDLQAQVERAVSQLQARGRAPITRGNIEHPDVAALIDGWRRSVDAWGTRPEQLSIDLDNGDPLGVFNEVVTLPLQERKAWRDEAQRWVSEHLRGLRKQLPKHFDKWLKLKVNEPGFLDANGDRFFTRAGDVVGAALHWDNPDNRAKLVEGLNYGKPSGSVSESDVAALLARHMTPEAQAYVRGMQNLFAHFKDDMFGMYRRVNGISPPDVGEHYFPITRDPRYLPEATTNPMQFAGDANYFRATPSNPHAKERTSAQYPLSLNLDIAQRRINQVIHDIAFREVLMDAHKFLGNRSVQNAIARKYGPEYASGQLGWLQNIAADLSFNARDSQAVKDFFDWTNEGMIIDMIGYSLHTTLLHAPTALVQSMQTVGARPFIGTLAEMMAKPKLWAEVWNESAEVRNRIINSSEGARQAFTNLERGRGIISQAQLYSMYMVSMSDQFSAMPTYLAAKRMFLSDPRTAPNAQALAEQQVRQAHGSAGVTEAPAALRGGNTIQGKFWKQANQFLTFWNHMYNRQREIGQALGFAGNKRDFGRAMAGVFSYIIAVGTIHHFVQQLYGQHTSWAEDVAMTPFNGLPLLNTIPFVLDMVHQHEPTDALESMLKSMGATMQDIHKVTEGKPPSQHWIQNAANTVGFITHTPGNQLGRTLAGLHDLHMRGATSPMQALHEILSGPPSAHQQAEGMKF